MPGIRFVRGIVLLHVGALLGLVLCELVFRLLAGRMGVDTEALERYAHHRLTGEVRDFEARAYTGFQRPRTGRGAANSFGFQDDPWERARTSGVTRIVCVGGSTTEGGNALGLHGSYPHLLERTLEARTGLPFEVMNAGISGWTSAEMLVSWFLTLGDFEPDVLVLHEAVNDLEPRFRAEFEPDYSAWRRPLQLQPASGLDRLLTQSSRMYLHMRLRRQTPPTILTVTTHPRITPEPLLAEGKLPHETSLPFRRNIASIARAAAADGIRVVLMTLPPRPGPGEDFWRYGILENNQHLRELAQEHGLILVDAERAFAGDAVPASAFIDLVHLEVGGNQKKADLLADALLAADGGATRAAARPAPGGS